MNRRQELIEIVCKPGSNNEIKALHLIDEIVFIEEQLAEIKKLPFISINPNNPSQQRTTPAAKQYKDLMQQYNNSLKLLLKISGDLGAEADEESPLRQWLRSRKEEKE